MSVVGAGFGILQDKTVTLNKGLLYLDDTVLLLWLLMLIIKLLYFQIS